MAMDSSVRSVAAAGDPAEIPLSPSPRPRRARSYLRRWPVTSLIALLAAVYLGLVMARLMWPRMMWLAVPLLVCLTFAVWLRGEPAGLLVARRLAFGVGSRRRARVRRRSGAQPWPGLLPAVFPGLQVREAHTRSGQSFGVATWENLAVAVVEIRHSPTGPVNSVTPARLPVERILTRVRTVRIPVRSLAFVTTATGGESHRSAKLQQVFEALGPAATTAAPVRTVVAIRLDPYQARDAVVARGGGHRGLVAALATLTGLVETELRAEGLSAAALEPRSLVAYLRDSMFETSEDGPLVQEWDRVTSGATVHRGFGLMSWSVRANGSLAEIFVRPGGGTATSVELYPEVSGRLRGRVWVRHSGSQAEVVRAAGWRTVRTVSPALRLVPADGQQLRALRATTAMGSDDAPQI